MPFQHLAEDRIGRRHDPRIYGTILGITILTIGVRIFGGLSLDSFALSILFVSVTLTGIPHGAVDHLVAKELYGMEAMGAGQALFYGGYVALMLLYGGLWLITPVWSFALFLVMTMYHFGQADLAYWNLSPLPARLLYLSRGLFIIGLPIVAFPSIVAPIFKAIARDPLLKWPFINAHSTSLFWGITLQHVLALGLATVGLHGNILQNIGREGGNLVVLGILFSVVHPLVAFAVYFGLWHSLGHILELLHFFRRRRSSPTTITGFYRSALFFTVLSFLGLGGLYAFTHSFGMENRMIALLFILIAIMTLPHMVVVEHLYRTQEEETLWPA